MGEGAFGFVRKAKDKRTGFVRAVKFIRKNQQLDLKKLVEEVEILKSIVIYFIFNINLFRTILLS